MCDTMNNKGIFKCENCGVYIKVKSTSRHRGYDYPKPIKVCPHCYGKIEEIDNLEYTEFEHYVWISVIKNNIKYSLKYPMVKKCTT